MNLRLHHPRFTRTRAVAAIGASAAAVAAGAGGVLVGTAGTAAAVSYNTGAAKHFHAPLSSAGMLAVNHSHQHLNDAIQEEKSGFAARDVPQQRSSATDLSGGLPSTASIDPGPGISRFIKDGSYTSQTETSVAVDPNNADHVVVGYNDSRLFFCPLLPDADCPDGYTASLSGFTVSTNGGATPTFTDNIPGMVVGTPPPKSFLASWGDPSVVATNDGKFYYASLIISPSTNANGIELAVSDDKLFSDPSSCTTPLNDPVSNPCWHQTFVFGTANSQAKTFEDKELVAVDAQNRAYVAWDHFNPDGTSSSYLARCTEALVCTMLSGGGAPLLSGSDQFAGFTTPAILSDGKVAVSWCNFGTTTTLGPIDCKVRTFDPQTDTWGQPHLILSLTTDEGLVGFATEQFRVATTPALAAGRDNALYFVVAACNSRSYFAFVEPEEPGNCGTSSVLFAASSDDGTTWSAPTAIGATSGVVIEPAVAFDPSNHHVDVVYYSSENDPYGHRLDVMQASAPDTDLSSPTITRLTSTSMEPNADPTYYDYLAASGFGGSFVVPQLGDYLQATAVDGTLYTAFSGVYDVELGTFQSDPYLARSGS